MSVWPDSQPGRLERWLGLSTILFGWLTVFQAAWS